MLIQLLLELQGDLSHRFVLDEIHKQVRRVRSQALGGGAGTMHTLSALQGPGSALCAVKYLTVPV